MLSLPVCNAIHILYFHAKLSLLFIQYRFLKTNYYELFDWEDVTILVGDWFGCPVSVVVICQVKYDYLKRPY